MPIVTEKELSRRFFACKGKVRESVVTPNMEMSRLTQRARFTLRDNHSMQTMSQMAQNNFNIAALRRHFDCHT